MLTIIGFLSGVLALGQTGERFTAAVRAAQGQEFVYRGTIHETNPGRPNPSSSRAYRLEARALVLESRGQGLEIAMLTVIRHSSQVPGELVAAAQPAAVRVELATVNERGLLSPRSSPGAGVPLDGPSTWECGFLIELPPEGVEANQSWSVVEPERPPRRYRVAGTEIVCGTTCLRIVGEQQSDDWSAPRADRAAWRRQETIWLNPRNGFATRVERRLERRAAAHRETTWRLTTRFELESALELKGMLLDDRRREIEMARTLGDNVNSLMPEAAQHQRSFDAIVGRIDHYAARQPANPYREALLAVRRLAVKGSRNELPPEVRSPNREARLVRGMPAPDLTAAAANSDEGVSLQKWRGRAVLLVFYHPGSRVTRTVFQYVQGLSGHGDETLQLLGVSIADDAAGTETLRRELNLTCPLVEGNTLRLAYNAEATPHLVLIDKEGLIYGIYTGWGPEIPAILKADLDRCLTNTSPNQ